MGKRIEAQDQLPYLPEPIIHHIFSLLPFKQLAKTSVLSKAWLRSWCLNPNLDFNHADFSNLGKFSEFLETTLLRYRRERIPIQRLRVRMTESKHKLASLVEDCVATAVQNHVEELELDVEPVVCMYGYSLFRNISTLKSLTVLKLSGCHTKEVETFRGSVKFDSLKELSLQRVLWNVDIIRSLIISCPHIEKLYLKKCGVAKKLKLDNLHRLKIVEVWGFFELEIDAPTLRSFTCQYVALISIIGHDLRDLYLSDVGIPGDFFDDLMVKFPLLGNLRLTRCDEVTMINTTSPSPKNLLLKECGRLREINLSSHSPKDLVVHDCGVLRAINISSHGLKNLVLNECRNLEDVKLDTPNLFFFGYKGCIFPSLSSTTSPRRWNVDLACVWIDPQWLLDLRKFLDDLKGNGVLSLLANSWNGDCTFNPEEFGRILIPPLQEIEHLDLTVKLVSSHEALVDGLLWSCHPKTISVESGTEEHNNLIMVLCGMLMERVDDPGCCSGSDDDIKCWRHYLRGLEIEIDGAPHVELATFLDSLASLEPHKVNFVLRW